MKFIKSRNLPVISVIIFSVLIMSITTFMTLKNTGDLRMILESSIKSELISASIAARGIIDIDRFDSYNSIEDIENDLEAYNQTLNELRILKDNLGATYIYALKLINGNYYFIFDTDTEEETLFEEYEKFEVHERAFLGEESAGIMNVSDEYGDFNTGAVPIWKNGRVIGIVSTDIRDTYVKESINTANRNAVGLILSLLLTMGAMIVIVIFQQHNVKKMQERLFKMANYDVLTGLPNRQFLMSYLSEMEEKALQKKTSFALMLIDLDNFKMVNDNAGHDAGDDLLRHIAIYLDTVHEHSKTFHPTSGSLNVSARIGGDEFVQVAPGVETEDEAEMIAKRVLENFTSNTLDSYIERYDVGLSIGVALFPKHATNVNELINHADIAMYYAKNSGKGTYRIYNDTMHLDDKNIPETPPTSDRRKYRR